MALVVQQRRAMMLSRLGRIFSRNAVIDSVGTRVHFDVAPETVWDRMLFYEEVPNRPMWILRWFLPLPIRTQGEKTRVGATIACTYENGCLEKCITAVERAHFIGFDVRVQKLGIEDCISMTGGSYEFHETPHGTDLVLTTLYRGHLRPRWLWRFVEQFLAHRLHRHILDGMSDAMPIAARARAATRTLPAELTTVRHKP